jgi:hypothetical protein
VEWNWSRRSCLVRLLPLALDRLAWGLGVGGWELTYCAT